MTYRANSKWNDMSELQALLIFKKLQRDNFPRGAQMRRCKAMAAQIHLKPGSISAKVCNYKSVAGVNRASNASANTTDIYKKYGHFSIEEITKIING